MRKNSNNKPDTVEIIAIAIAAALGVIALLWWGMSYVPAQTARAWALIATALIPMGMWAGWRFGQIEARGVLSGLDKGVDKVMGAAGKTAELRVNMHRAVRVQPAVHPVDTGMYRVIEQPSVVHRIEAPSDEIVDL